MTRFVRFPVVAALVAVIVFGLATAAAAQTVGAPPPVSAVEPPSLMALLGKMMPMFLMVFMIFYFLVLRPQQRRLTDHQKLIESLKRGDTVITSGGIFGRVASIEKESILIEVASGVKVKVEAAHIAKRQDRAAESKTAA